MRLIGVLGGMGPEATVLMMQRLIETQGAEDDSDHIPLLVHSNPQIPSRLTWLLDGVGTDPAPVIADMARRLQAGGAEALAMPCNTAHAFADQIRAAVDIPLIDMIALTADHLAASGKGARIGILASPGSRKSGVYDGPLKARGLVPVYGDNTTLLAIIRAAKAGRITASDHANLASQARMLIAEQSCTQVLIACTELSLMTPQLPTDLDWVDSLDLLVTAVRAFAMGAPR